MSQSKKQHRRHGKKAKPSAHKKGSFSVVTYNCRGSTSSIKNRSHDELIKQIVALESILAKNLVDVLFLQCIDSVQFQHLRKNKVFKKYYRMPASPLKENPTNVVCVANTYLTTPMREEVLGSDTTNTNTTNTTFGGACFSSVKTKITRLSGTAEKMVLGSLTLQPPPPPSQNPDMKTWWCTRKKQWESVLERVSEKSFCCFGVTTYSREEGRDKFRIPSDWRDAWLCASKPRNHTYTVDGHHNALVSPHDRFRYDRIVLKIPYGFRVAEFKLLGRQKSKTSAQIHFGLKAVFAYDSRHALDKVLDLSTESSSLSSSVSSSSSSYNDDTMSSSSQQRKRYQKQTKRKRRRKQRRHRDIASSTGSSSSLSNEELTLSYSLSDHQNSQSDSLSTGEMTVQHDRQHKRNNNVHNLVEYTVDPRQRGRAQRGRKFGDNERRQAYQGFKFDKRSKKRRGRRRHSYSDSSSSHEGVMDKRYYRERMHERKQFDKSQRRMYNDRKRVNHKLSKKERLKLFTRGNATDRRGVERHVPSAKRMYSDKYYERKEMNRNISKGLRRREKRRFNHMNNKQASRYAFRNERENDGDEQHYRKVDTQHETERLMLERERDERDLERDLSHIHGRGYGPSSSQQHRRRRNDMVSPPPSPSRRRRY